MHITVGSTNPVKKDPSTSDKNHTIDKKEVQRERRRNRKDRRKSVREGVIVTLSVKNDRRSGRDRRKTG